MADLPPQTPPHSTKGRDLYDWIDMSIKFVTLAVAIFLAFQALEEYRKDVKQKLFDERVTAFRKAINAAGQIVLAKDWDTFGEKLDEFGVINHGEVLATFGDGPAYNAMVHFYNILVEMWNKNLDQSAPIPTDQVEEAYENLSKTFGLVVNTP